MQLSKKPYKGTRDFFPAEKRALNYIVKKLSESAELYGYENFDGPLLEELDLYRAKSGEELVNEQLYSFKDRGGREVAIRPELTPTVARMVASIHREVSKPIRWYSMPQFMRYERAQRGRLREFWQFNCDIFGASGRNGEIEILQILISIMQNFGAESSMFEILVNDRQIVDMVFNQILKLDEDKSYRLYKITDASKKLGPEGTRTQLEENGFDQNTIETFMQYLSLTSFEGALEFLKSKDMQTDALELETFIQMINDLGISDFIKYDPAIVRGLDYYTGIVFEVFDKHPDNRRAICGGGAYANLLKIFNEEPLPGVGFGLGDVTMKDFLVTHGLMPDTESPENDLFLTIQDESCRTEALKLASKLRNNGVRVVANFDPVKFKKAFSNAEKKGALFVSLMGDRELNEGLVQIKNMKTKEQHNVALDDIETLTKILKS